MQILDRFIMFIFIAGVISWFFIPTKKVTNTNILVNNIYYGDKISENLYKFSVLDYHRLLMSKRPFGLLFCSNTRDCEKHEQLIRQAKLQTVVLQINPAELSQDLYKSMTAVYQIKTTPAIISLDKDSNVTGKITSINTPDEIKKLFH